MKKTLIYIALFLFVLSAASCTDEVMFNEQTELQVTAGIVPESRTTFIDDGEWTHTHWVANDLIGLSSDKETNIAYKAVSNGSSTDFTQSGNASIASEEGKKVKAYYPYNSKASGNNIPLPYTIGQSASKPASAFLYSEATINKNALNFKFKHLFAYLKLTITTQQYKANLPQGCSLKGGGFYIMSDNPISIYDATFNLETQTITHNNPTNTVVQYYIDNMEYNSNQSYTFLIPILPQPADSPISVNLYYPIDDQEGYVRLVTLADKNTPKEGFLACSVYELNIGGSTDAETQKQLLTEFYQSTQGTQWSDNTNWLSDKPLEEWYGLNQEAGGLDYVQTMDLGYNNLKGTIPESFAEIMTTASHINISQNALTGTIPDAVKNHHKWKSLGWLIVPQNPHVGGGLDLTDSKLYMPSTETVNLIDNSSNTLKNIFSQNKLTQVICVNNPSDVSEIMNQFPASRVNKHLDYVEKGFATVIFTNGNNSEVAKGIQERYGNIDGIHWMTGTPRISVYFNMTYVFDSNGQLVHIAAYNNMYDNTQVDATYTELLKSVFGEPAQHDEFSFDFYTSTDYSKDGEVFTIQKASKGKGINLVFSGEGFVDTDMGAGGKYETKMKEAADKMFELEPYKSLRDRFNLYGVKVVSPTAEFTGGAEKRINENYDVSLEYASKFDPNLPDDARMMVVVVYNSDNSVGRSYCALFGSGDFVTFVMDGVNNTLIHEACGHGIAKLADEYVEGGYEAVTLPDDEKKVLDDYHNKEWGWFTNVDYNSTKSTVKWSQLLNDSRYSNDGLGIYEGAYTFGKGVYRPSENSMMRHNIAWFNAASREIIYKAVMTLSEGKDWKYSYEDFVSFDADNRASSKARSAVMQQSHKEMMEFREKHRKPVFIQGSWRDAVRRSRSNNINVPLR